MDRNDQQAIADLFERLAAAERQAPPRDAEAEALIRDRIAGQPAAPYFMAQTIVVLERALAETNARVEALEAETEAAPKRSGGFFGGLFGDDAPRSPNAMPRVPRRGAPGMPQSGGGGFLAGAAQTAVGVAGGVLLGSVIAGMFGAGAAEAAEPAPPEEPIEDPAGGEGDFGDFEL